MPSRPKTEGDKKTRPAGSRFFSLAPNSKAITVVFRWLVILVLACFMVFSPEKYSPQRLVLLLAMLLVYLVSNFILSFMSEETFQKSRIGRVVFFADIILISAIMYFIRGFETDLYLVYFLIIFVAAIQHGGVRRSWVIGLVTAVLYVGLYLRNNSFDSLLSSYVLLRVPFFFLVAVFSAYHSDQLGKEVTRRQEAEEKSLQVLEKYRTLVNTLPDIIFELDEEGRFTFVSEAVRGAGYSPQELLGQHFSVILPPEEMKQVSRKTVLETKQGQATGDRESPKLFDERRTGGRMTRNLVTKMRLGPSAVGRESTMYVEMHSCGKWGLDKGSGKKMPQGSFGIIRDMKVPEIRSRKNSAS